MDAPKRTVFHLLPIIAVVLALEAEAVAFDTLRELKAQLGPATCVPSPADTAELDKLREEVASLKAQLAARSVPLPTGVLAAVAAAGDVAIPLIPRLEDWIRHYESQFQSSCEQGFFSGAACGSEEIRRHVLYETYDTEVQERLLYTGSKARLSRAIPSCGDRPTSPKQLTCTFGWSPPLGETMLAPGRLDNIRQLLSLAKKHDLPGGYVEAGVWRGGASVYAASVMRNIGFDRHQFICDSFQGLPPRRSHDAYSQDDAWAAMKLMSVSLPVVRDSFAQHGLLNDKKHFFEGFFVDSMPKLREYLIANKQTISVLRMDGDMYESTIDLLFNLYDLVDVGGYVIVDDFGWDRADWAARWAAINFRIVHGIEDDDHPMIDIDGSGAFWRKSRHVEVQKWRYPNNTEPAQRVTAEKYLELRAKWERLRPNPWPPQGVY